MKVKHHVAQQLLDEQDYEKNNGPIDMTADQLWKYSGKVEPYTTEYLSVLQDENERVEFIRYYKKRIKDKDIFLFLNSKESRIIDYFYTTGSNLSIAQMSKDLGHSKDYVGKIISKHLKIQKDDKNNTGKLP